MANVRSSPIPRDPTRVFAYFACRMPAVSRALTEHGARAQIARLELWSAMLPGRGSRAAEAPVTRMQALVDELSQAVSERADKPYALFLATAWEPWWPSNSHGVSTDSACPARDAYSFRLHRRPTRRAQARSRALSTTPRPSSASASWGASPPRSRTTTEAMVAALPALQADRELVCTYQAPFFHLLACPITVLGALVDPSVKSRSTGRLEPLDSGELCHPHVSRRPFLSTAAHCCAAQVVRKRAGRVGTNSELKSSSHIANTGVVFDVADHGVVVVRFDDDRSATLGGLRAIRNDHRMPCDFEHLHVVVVVSKHHDVFHVDAEVGSKLAQRIRLGGGLGLDRKLEESWAVVCSRTTSRTPVEPSTGVSRRAPE